MIKPWKLLDSQLAFDSPYIKIERRTYRLPDGSVVDDYLHLKRPNFVVIIATDGQDRILVIRQYRRGIDRIIVELPAGWIEKGEKPCDAALRELKEETGFSGTNPVLAGFGSAQPAFTDMLGYAVRLEIQNPKDITEWTPLATDESGDEIAEHKFITKDELQKLIDTGEFCSENDLTALRLAGM